MSHIRYPNVLGIDITYKTNAENHPLFVVVGKNTRNKNLPLVHAFLPSQQRYVFKWLFATALPRLLTKEKLKETSLITSDQDAHCLEALTAVLRANDKIYSKALIRLCKWHKVSEISYVYTYVNSLFIYYIHICNFICIYITLYIIQSCFNVQVNRGYQLMIKKWANTQEDKDFIEEIRDWMYSFVTYIESEDEEKDSLIKLKMVINRE